MVAKGEIRRKGRVLKAAMARVQDGRPSLDCARCGGVFHTAQVIRYRNGLAAICSFYPIATLETDIRVPIAAEWGPVHHSSFLGQSRKAAAVLVARVARELILSLGRSRSTKCAGR
jgi:hypothetical protein